jgi:hypothetical protein
MVSNFVKKFIRHHPLDRPIPPTITLDHYDDECCNDDGGDNDMTLSTIALQIQIQIEDFGGSFAMLHLGIRAHQPIISTLTSWCRILWLLT